MQPEIRNLGKDRHCVSLDALLFMPHREPTLSSLSSRWYLFPENSLAKVLDISSPELILR